MLKITVSSLVLCSCIKRKSFEIISLNTDPLPEVPVYKSYTEISVDFLQK